MAVQIAAATHVGCVRERNEDCVVVGSWLSQGRDTVLTRTYAGDGSLLLAVLDGMGGHVGGDLASLLAGSELTTLDGVLATPVDAGALEGVVVQANDAILRVARGSRELADMGATVAALVLSPRAIDVFNVGDARVDRIVGGYLGRMTIDDRVQDGPGRGAVSQSLGRVGGRRFDVHHVSLDVVPGTTLLVSSDGLTDVVAPEAIGQAIDVGRHLSVEKVARSLVALALAAGAPDNVSAILVRVEEE